MDRRFFHRLGASQLERAICSAAGEAGLKSVIGVKLGTEPEQFRQSRYIIAWGANIHGNNVHLWPFIEEARRTGAKLVVIDPYRTRTAKCADWYLPINPGTDAALALGMMHVIIGEGLLRRRLRSELHYGVRAASGEGEGVSARAGGAMDGNLGSRHREAGARIRDQASGGDPLNYGVQRSEGGGMAMRAITMLPCITGSWKEVGGGLQLSTSGAWGLKREALENAELMQASLGRPARVVNMVELGKALNTLDDPPIKALFVYNSNPAAVCPNHNDVIRGLAASRTCSPWCTSSSSPTPRTTRTSCCRRRLSSSRKTCRRRTGTTTCRCRIRRSSRWENAGRTSKYSGRWRRRWDSKTHASTNRWTR